MVGKDPGAEDNRLIQFNTSDRYAHMMHARWLAERTPEARERGIEALSPDYDLAQTITESIDAEEALLDMISTVVRKPLLRVWEETHTDRKRETQTQLQVRVLHTELVIFASVDEINDLRKTVDHRKQWLGMWRAKAYALLAEARITSAPDNWYLGSADDQPLRNLVFADPQVVDPAIYLGYLWERAERWSRRTGGDPLDYVVRPAPEIGGWHLRSMRRLLASFNTLLDLMELTSKRPEDTEEEIALGAEGGYITDRDLRSRWTDLVQFEKDEVVWTYWEMKEGRAVRPHAEPGPGLEPHATPYRDLALWYDWWWTMCVDHYVFPQLVEYMNERSEEAEFPVRVTADGPDSNYFRHLDFAHGLWKNQPIEPIIKRLKWIWKREVASHTIHIRPVLYKEVLSGLPSEMLAGLFQPDRELLTKLRTKAEQELAKLGPIGPTTAEAARKQAEELRGKIAWYTRGINQASEQLDSLTKFVQKLNRLSDKRVRMWCGFLTHGKRGSIMGLDVGETLRFVKEGYAADTGLMTEDQFDQMVDLVTMGWLSGQFNKSVYLSRSIAYLISVKVNPMERHKAIGGSIQGGHHPVIAHYVAEGIGGLDDLLGLTEDSKATKFVQDIFEAHEVEKLGRSVVKEILERSLFRKEMAEMAAV